MRRKLKTYSLGLCLFVFLFVIIGGGLHLGAGDALLGAMSGTPLVIFGYNRLYTARAEGKELQKGNSARPTLQFAQPPMKWLRSVFLLLVFASVLLRYNRFFTHQGFWIARHGAPVSGPTSGRGLHDRYLPSVLSHPKELPSGVLPRHDLTPGAVDPRITQQNIGNTICRPGYSASVRPPFKDTNAIKHQLMRDYGVAESIHDYELDHLIPIGVGGCPDCESNLWPEPKNIFPGAKEKDEVEDYLHRQVCSGALSLSGAQQELASNWYEVYQRLHAHGTSVRSKGEQ